MPLAECPECQSEIHIETFQDRGDTVECDDCGAELEIVGLDPLELDLSSGDWDDDEDE